MKSLYFINILAYIVSFFLKIVIFFVRMIKMVLFFFLRPLKRLILEVNNILNQPKRKGVKTKKNRIKYRIKNVLLRKIGNKVFVVIRLVGNKIYWTIRFVGNKIYWGIRFVVNKIYWTIRFVGNKIYWGIRFVVNKIYWTIRFVGNKIYWMLYEYKQKLYFRCIKNKYLKLFIVLCKSHLNSNEYRVKFYPIINYDSYHLSNKDCFYEVIEYETERSVYKPHYFEKSNAEELKFKSNKIYVGELKNAKIIGASDVVIADHKLIHDSVFQDKEHRVDISYNSIKFTINNYAIIEEKKESRCFENGIYLLGAASFNYYHLLIEILSRITIVDELEKFHDFPLLIDRIVEKIPQYKRALELLNKSNREIVYINQGEEIIVKNMIFPSHIVWMPINVFHRSMIRDSDYMISEKILKNIRNALHLTDHVSPTEKIFISRKNTSNLRLKNETEVRDLFKENGFKIVYTEDMTFDEQIKCFENAKHIVGATGAALTNIIYCSPGATVTCIIPEELQFYIYSTMAGILGLKSTFLNATIVEKTMYIAADSYSLDIEYAKRYIENECTAKI